MEKNQLTTTIFYVLLLQLGFTCLAAHEEQKTDVVVEGMVYCQSCKHYGSWSLADANPIDSAKVSVICKNYRNLVSYYKAFETDEKGYFYAQLEGFKMNNDLLDHPLQSCHVKLVSSPLANCSVPSSVNYGLNGSPLRYEKLLRGPHYEAALYSAGPLAFHPVHCPPPTHE